MDVKGGQFGAHFSRVSIKTEILSNLAVKKNLCFCWKKIRDRYSGSNLGMEIIMIGKRIRDVLSTENDDADVVESHQDDSDDETQAPDTMDMDLKIQELQEKHIADEIYEDIEIRGTTLFLEKNHI
ncbi:sodium/calcium exchanger 1 [Striga asiatica]|uniref:Sodium/calcium exchanger 1 n=1 Tax=Striga asiatica TaxID=4170 RepID=A0A5A7Q8G4_STRAF|nr:sodium/calcium exchanger 1 [Striga asiatica]